MTFQVGHPWYLLLVPAGLAWIVWLAWKSDVQTSPVRRWTAFGLRCVIVTAVALALAELQMMWPLPGVNVFYLLDGSQSVPAPQLEFARTYVNKSAYGKERVDGGGVVVFGSQATIEHAINPAVDLHKIESVIDPERTDIAGAIQLATVAFPEAGQKRIVLLSDGNENLGDAAIAAAQAKSLGVSIDVVPLGAKSGHDVSLQKLVLPPKLKKGQSFEARVFINSDRAGPATVSLYRNNQFLGKQKVEVAAGKNLFSFPQTLAEPGFYNYDVQVEAEGDTVPQNNRANGFVSVKGDPRILVISADPEADKPLLEALQSSRIQIDSVGINRVPGSLAELQSYDSIFLSNVAGGDLGRDVLLALESAVRDFGVGLVCVGGDQTYTAGAYRGTPLENVLPVQMELDSKKVLPSGALALVIDKSGSMSGPKIEAVKQAAMGAVTALGDQDYIGVLAFDGAVYPLSGMQKAVNKKELLAGISGLHAGGGTAMYPPMEQAYQMLKGVKANLKHLIVLTDGDSLPGDFEGITRAMANDKITVSTVGVGGDINIDLLQSIAALGKGRFYQVTSPELLPQIFIKETAIVLKVAIDENPFKPQLRSASEVIRGIATDEYPALLGHVITTPKPRAETPLWSPGGDPLLAHWQYGLGRAVAFTSDAQAKWGKNWVSWAKYNQFWSQIAQWSLRRLENPDFTTEVAVDSGEGRLNVDALDSRGDYQNFLTLKAIVISPKGEKQTVTLAQTGAGHYEARFPAHESGLYMLNLLDEKEGQVRGSQMVGASMNYSPEYNAAESNLPLLRRLAEIGAGRVLNPENPTDDNPYFHDRVPTYRSLDLWEWLMRAAVVLFVFDVGVRRLQLERSELARAWRGILAYVIPWRPAVHKSQAAESLSALLARREQVRSNQPKSTSVIAPAPKIEGPVVVPEKSNAPESGTAEEPSGTTSRLLEAKRRAKER